MSNILLVEPDYRSKFPPLGLMKLSTYHKGQGDNVTFIRGNDHNMKGVKWHRIYISSLFTWELPRTLKAIEFYSDAVDDIKDVYVGGVGVTLLPTYIRERSECTVIEGQLDKPNMLGRGSRAIAKLIPDYSLLENIEYEYYPKDAYFTRITKGCIRSCKFCAVPILEKDFGFLKDLRQQIDEVDSSHGERQHLVVMDNNILGIENIESIINDIRLAGFEAGAKRNGKQRTVDFNQGLDARIINAKPRMAELLASISTHPVRLAFDFIAMEKAYRNAVKLLKTQGFFQFTNYMLFNFKDTPKDLYDRFMINAALNEELEIRITGFPMRFIPMDDVHRGYISQDWKWRYLRGIQCVLLATRGLVSPNPKFIKAAFGASYDEFLEILSMPDRYIIYREEYKKSDAKEWKKLYRKMSIDQRNILLDLLATLNSDIRGRKTLIQKQSGAIKRILEHYYPNGDTAPKTPDEDRLVQQGVSAGYDSGPG